MKKSRPTTSYIYTISGQAIYPEEVTEAQINLDDIAYGLSNIYRYNGHTRISVLRHSIALSLLFNEPRKALYGLMHDATEAYLMDVPVPKKKYMRKSWLEMSDKFDRIIFKKFNVPQSKEVTEEVQVKDKELVVYEMCIAGWREGHLLKHPTRVLPLKEFQRVHTRYLWNSSEDELIKTFKARYDILAGDVNRTSTSSRDSLLAALSSYDSAQSC